MSKNLITLLGSRIAKPTMKTTSAKSARRLVTRGAAVESIAPSVKEMSEVEFYELAEKIFALPEVQNLIAKEVR